jgi:hypothetical protein
MKRLFSRKALIAMSLALCVPAPGQYISDDTYARYELLAPESHQFKIYYEVTEPKPGARFYFNPIREGSIATDESASDRATGAPLKLEVVTGAQAKADDPSQDFDAAGKYLKVHFAHAVPADGEYRIAIIKTYKDDKSYYKEGEMIVFTRTLSIPHDSVVLPPGYEVVFCSVAAQLLTEPDGRLKLSFVNPGSGADLGVTIKARRLPAGDKRSEAPR